MAKSKPAAAETPPAADPRKDGIRETVESIVIAFVLAFLFRTFEAEAFVIPTGSMAPTLMGRHKDVVCEKCGFPYQASASGEVDDKSTKQYPCEYFVESKTEVREKSEGEAGKPDELVGYRLDWKCRHCGDKYTQQIDLEVKKVDPRLRVCPSYFVRSCTCPLCRWTMQTTTGPAAQREMTEPSYKGDRILVGKFNYEFGDPERWDVVVFKYPEDAQINFIKRLIGLPNETLRIEHGNIYTRPLEDAGPFRIARKPPDKVRAMLQVVHDNDYILADELVQRGWPVRWHADGPGWTSDDGGRSFGASAAEGEEAWVRYRHYVPTYEDWHLPPAELADSPRALNPQLIADFTGYNANFPTQSFETPAERNESPPQVDVLGQHWVGDLAVECQLEAQSSAGEALLELVEGGRRFRCRIDLASGTVTLTIDGEGGFTRTAETAVKGPGSYHLAIANVDDQLLLWVDGALVEFEGGTEYEGLENHAPRREDLAPVGVGTRGAKLHVEHLRVLRDAYYITTRNNYSRNHMRDYQSDPSEFHHAMPDSLRRALPAERLAYVMSTPDMWGMFADRQAPPEYLLDADRFLVLGDNSPFSKDSRLWQRRDGDRAAYAVTRDLLIGKAIFIYWPHSFDELPGTEVPFPFFPNFDRMQFVR